MAGVPSCSPAAELRDGIRSLLSAPLRSAYWRAQVCVHGAAVMPELQSGIGRADWALMLANAYGENSAAASEYVAGFGVVAADFLCAPIVLSPQRREEILALGARVNLIVSLYDRLLDSGHAASDILPATGGSEVAAALSGLIAGFYRRAPGDDRLVRKAVERMRAAEDRPPSAMTRLLWRRKNALPFVLIAILAAERAAAGRIGYLAWAYRFGVVLGWVDDAADLTADQATGQWNRWIHAPTSPAEVLGALQRVLIWWEGCRPEARHHRDQLLYCLYEWLSSAQRRDLVLERATGFSGSR